MDGRDVRCVSLCQSHSHAPTCPRQHRLQPLEPPPAGYVFGAAEAGIQRHIAGRRMDTSLYTYTYADTRNAQYTGYFVYRIPKYP